MGFQLILDTHLHTFNVKVVDVHVLIGTVGRGRGVRSVPFTFSFIFYMLIFLKMPAGCPSPSPTVPY